MLVSDSVFWRHSQFSRKNYVWSRRTPLHLLSHESTQPSHGSLGDFVFFILISSASSVTTLSAFSVTTPPASSVTTPSASSVTTLSAVSSAATPFTSVATPLSSAATPSPPAQLQLRPPPDPPPCTSSPVPLEACSPPKPPDPPDVPLSLLLLLLFDTTSSQPFSKSPDLKYPLLNLVLVFSHGVISLVYVDDTSFVSKCLSPAVCSVFLYWCVDWSPWGPVDWGPHRFSPSNFTCPPLPFITLVIVFVDSTMGCSIPIFVSLPLPLIQSFYCSMQFYICRIQVLCSVAA
ncbi:Uncharacterized protein Rs2_50668 [Raphanus sativus]|nr:Uncharacterized protein Rs2_50668 [Raphanus sativus]